MRTHAHAGVELLRPADLSPIAISVVRDHHERIDGSGYPEGLHGAQVQEFPRIAAVADVYDAVTSERVYKPAAPPHVGVHVIREGTGSQFCPSIVRHFRAVVMPYPVGHEIKLPDGRAAVVASVDIESPDVPTVRVTGAGVEEFAVDMTAAPSASSPRRGRPVVGRDCALSPPPRDVAPSSAGPHRHAAVVQADRERRLGAGAAPRS